MKNKNTYGLIAFTVVLCWALWNYSVSLELLDKFYKIILTGGGSLLYEKQLIELFDDPRILIKENAIMANCKGFWLLGNY